jgi:hypothetical protein
MKRGLLLPLAVAVAACFPPTGPWLDESGQPLEGSQVVEYQGFRHCGHEDVQFLVFFGDMYAKDPEGALGPLANSAGDPLSYAVLTELPPGVVAQGITFRDREIYFDPETREDYLYIHFESGSTERWPRAESACDRPGA